MPTSPARFGLKFLIGFSLLVGAFEASRGTTFERVVVEQVMLRPSVALINIVTPDEQATLTGRLIESPGANLRVTRGCEGIELFILLIAAILAFPASLARRFQATILGCALAYVLSLARLMTLHYVLRYDPRAWEMLHGLVLPLGPIVLLALFFLHWTSWVRPTDDSRQITRAA